MHTKEQRLAAALKKGDTSALAKIIDSCAGYVCAVIRNFSRGAFTEEDIDEICSDVFFGLWEHREGIDAELGLKAYLSAIARNAVKNRFRSTKPPTVDIEELELADSFSVEYKAELNDLMRELDSLIKALPDEEREIFMRFYFYGQKSSEIALIMDTAEGTVRSRLSRTRAKLRKELRNRGVTMRRFFEEHMLDNDGLSEDRVKNIKASVLARAEEVMPMKKRFKFKPLIIAVSAIATMAMSAVTVNALSSGDNPLIKINGKLVDAYYTTYVDEEGYTVDIYVVDFPEEVLMAAPKNIASGPVGEMKVVGDFDAPYGSEDSVAIVDENGDLFPVVGSDWTFGKYVMIARQKDGVTGYSIGCNGGGVKEEYGTELRYSPNDKSLTVEFHKNLFDTIADTFKQE